MHLIYLSNGSSKILSDHFESFTMTCSTVSICRCQNSIMHAACLIRRSVVGTQINVAANPLRTNWKAPAVQNVHATLHTNVPVAPRQIHISPRHSQLSVIAHAIFAWVYSSSSSCVIATSPHSPSPFCQPDHLSTLLPSSQNGQDQDHRVLPRPSTLAFRQSLR